MSAGASSAMAGASRWLEAMPALAVNVKAALLRILSQLLFIFFVLRQIVGAFCLVSTGGGGESYFPRKRNLSSYIYRNLLGSEKTMIAGTDISGVVIWFQSMLLKSNIHHSSVSISASCNTLDALC